MINDNLILTGLTGYIGSKLVNRLKNYNLHEINRHSFDTEYKIFSDQDENNEFTLVHLATFFSKDNSKEKEIYDGNIIFGNKILEAIDEINVKKIIYTNTMFNFYKEKELRECIYSKTKKEFSDTLKEYCISKKILYEEIYLDNTFGINDKRPKLIPLIVKKIKNKEQNPIKNPNNLINLMHVEDVVERILISINSNYESSSTAFVSDYSINVNSIYEFLSYYSQTRKINKDLIIKCKNEYTKESPTIDHKSIQIRDNLIELTKLI